MEYIGNVFVHTLNREALSLFYIDFFMVLAIKIHNAKTDLLDIHYSLHDNYTYTYLSTINMMYMYTQILDGNV